MQYTKQLNTEIKNLVDTKWNFLGKPWPEIHHRFNHKTVIKNMKGNTMDEIKDTLLHRFGFIPFYDCNLLHPIRKEPGQKLTVNETQLNNKFESFRSAISAQSSMLGSKVELFNNNRVALQISDIKYYNIQLRIACFLTNIRSFVNKYDIEVQPHHKSWYGKHFEFPSKKNKLDLVFSNEQKQPGKSLLKWIEPPRPEPD
ncbi:hypothetical protein INT45_000968 [Circinella minor]|uniref:Uncharacterized protein n=1 Tax=Circinella minor TaxID=1195481 RepID=A0A8H7VCQ4_9FUNG|nr:hypothetical protein INT45_000968 [Circinella minor]